MLRKIQSTTFSGKSELLQRQTATVTQGFDRVLESLPWPRFRVELAGGRITVTAPQQLTVAHGVRQPVSSPFTMGRAPRVP